MQQGALSETEDIPKEELERLIIEYVTEHGRAYPSDIAADLRAPYFSVTDLINRLVETGILEPAAGETS